MLAKPRVCTVGPTSDVRIPRSSSSMRFLSDGGEYNDVQNLHTSKVSPVVPIRWVLISFIRLQHKKKRTLPFCKNGRDAK